MITEDSISDHPEKKPQSTELKASDSPSPENSEDLQDAAAIPDELSPETSPTEASSAINEPSAEQNNEDLEEKQPHQTDAAVAPSEEIPSQFDGAKTDDGETQPDSLTTHKTETSPQVEETPEPQADSETEISADKQQEETPAETDSEKTNIEELHENEETETSEERTETAKTAEKKEQNLTLPEVLKELEKIINRDDAGAFHRDFNQWKEYANQLISTETENEKADFILKGNPEENFSFQHPMQDTLSHLTAVFREKNDAYNKQQEQNHIKNLEERQRIIENLKNLYTNTEPGTNLFKAIRIIKEEWKNAGQVAKSEFKLLNNNYFHHLNQFYQMLDMNKEYLEQEYAHNLEKRQHIISRAKELETEPAVQKALNELQYLHKLWKEEAEPVAEEFREKTWEEFKEISNRIHERKTELSAQLEQEQNENLEKKNKIIEEIKKISAPEKEPNHNYWQNAIKKVEELRNEFLKIGSVPRKVSNQNWNEFKLHLRNFNTKKNQFYKGLKNSQQSNLDEKLKLIQSAKDNMHSEDWDVTVPLFKKLQEDWKKIGHVPRSMTNKVWEDFREACNVFFNNYRQKNSATGDNWQENYKQKQQLLEELKTVTDEEGSIEKIENIKTNWNNIGKVPRDKIAINTEFNKTLRDKLRLNKIEGYALKEEGLSENQLTDKARKIKNQIGDLEAEIVKMENNLGFFSNSSRENPLLKETFTRIEEKKAQLENMKKSLHQILAGENQ